MTKRPRSEHDSTARRNRRRIDDAVEEEEVVDLLSADDPKSAAASVAPVAAAAAAVASGVSANGDGKHSDEASVARSSSPPSASSAAAAVLAAAASDVVIKLEACAAALPSAEKPAVQESAVERDAKVLHADLSLQLAKLKSLMDQLTLEDRTEKEAYERSRNQRVNKTRLYEAQQSDVNTRLKLLTDALTKGDVGLMRDALTVKVKSAAAIEAELKANAGSSSANRALPLKGGSDAPLNAPISSGGAGASPKKAGTKSPVKVRLAADKKASYIKWLVENKGAFEWADRSGSDNGGCKGCGANPSDHWANDAKPAAADGNGEPGAWMWVCPKTRELHDPPVMA